MNNDLTVTPAVMIGGAGSRLWPLSRANKPKQFLNLTGDASMFQDTLTRFAEPGFNPAWLLANGETLPHVFAQLGETGGQIAGIVVEPAMRGTAAAIAAIVSVLNESEPDTLLLIAPADHFIRDEPQFLETVRRAAPLARDGAIVTFGIRPTAPETGFGYIAGGEPIAVGTETVGYRIGLNGFREKPDRATAEQFVADGYLWNAGIFLFKVSAMFEELQRHAPETLAAVAAACAARTERSSPAGRIVMPDGAAFIEAPLELSIDVAVMERTDKAVVVPCQSIGWSDVGSLSALWEIAPKDVYGNAARGDAMFHNSRNVFAHSDRGRKIVAAHLDGILIVDTEDALIVLPTSQAQAVKSVVQHLRATDAAQLRYERDAQFEWGEARLDHDGLNYAAMSARLSAGETLKHRCDGAFETWTVLKGAVSVSSGHQHRLLKAGQSFTALEGEQISLIALDEAARLAVVASPLDGQRHTAFFTAKPEPGDHLVSVPQDQEVA